MFRELNNNQSTGFICLFRSICEHWIYDFSKPELFQRWMDILLNVNHTDRTVRIKGTLYECKRGESLNSLHTWAKRWRCDVNAARRFLKMLEKDGMIEYKSEGRTIRITVCNYESYQGVRKDSERKKKGKRNEGETKVKTNNNDNNDNKVISMKPDQSEMAELKYTEEERHQFAQFTEWVERNAPSVARMKEPFTIDQYLKVRSMMTAERMYSLIEDMENWEGLKKRVSAYKTFRTFHKNSSQTPVAVLKPNTSTVKRMVI